MPAIRVIRDHVRNAAAGRFQTLAEHAEAFLASGILGQPEEVFLDEYALAGAVEAYYLLTFAYKAERTDPESPTQPPKIAALSALVFEEFRPLRRFDPGADIINPMTVQANRLFSLYWGAIVFDQNLSSFFTAPRSKDTLARYFRVLRATRLNSLVAYKRDRANRELREYYDILLDHDTDDLTVTVAGKPSPQSDMPVIDTMILIFELMWAGRGEARLAVAAP